MLHSPKFGLHDYVRSSYITPINSRVLHDARFFLYCLNICMYVPTVKVENSEFIEQRSYLKCFLSRKYSIIVIVITQKLFITATGCLVQEHNMPDRIINTRRLHQSIILNCIKAGMCSDRLFTWQVKLQFKHNNDVL